MSFARRSRLALESLDCRLVPAAAVLNLAGHGAAAAAPSGAIVRQLDAGSTDSGSIHGFVRLQQGLLGSLLGGTEQGYNTDARPQQFDESSDASLTHSLTLGQVPVVMVNGVAYREFFLTVNQSVLSPNLSVDEVRIFLGASGNLSNYNASTKQLGGQSAAFDLDSGGDVSIKLNNSLNSDSSSPDMALLIPDSAFAGASANTFVYLYSKMGGLAGASANGGFEQWGVGDVPVAPPAPPSPPPPPAPAAGSLAGFAFVDGNHNGVWDQGESGMAGETIMLQGVDYLGNAVSLAVQTGSDGSFAFTGVLAGTYTLTEQPLFGYASGTATAGTDGGDAGSGQVANINFGGGDTASGYLFGDVYHE